MIGWGEITSLIVLILILIAFTKPEKIREFARSIGSGIREFKKAMEEKDEKEKK